MLTAHHVPTAGDILMLGLAMVGLFVLLLACKMATEPYVGSFVSTWVQWFKDRRAWTPKKSEYPELPANYWRQWHTKRDHKGRR